MIDIAERGLRTVKRLERAKRTFPPSLSPNPPAIVDESEFSVATIEMTPWNDA
jgi:hypothetical protein